MQVKVEDVFQHSYCSAMQRGTSQQFCYVIADPKMGEKHICQNIINVKVFKLQVIYSTVRT